MKVSLKWLRSYTPVSVDVANLAHRLTMAGVEVANVYHVGQNWNDVYVGQVTEIKRHPNADRLLLVTVNWGDNRDITVVTGAPNLKVGDKVPLALAGAMLVDTHLPTPEIRELKPAKIRGILSEGMVCSAKELGLGEDHAGILILDPDARPGTPLAEELGDVILDLELTPNRVDLLSMIGVAREVSALLAEPLTVPRAEYAESGPPVGTLIDVRIVDPDLCPRYTAAVIQGVTIGQSPKWLRERLTAAGLRPINNIVDVTNYVMLEWGQPLHAFDYDKIRGREIIVRRAGDGETLTLLDGSVRLLTSANLVIADAEGAVAVAGVMGGADSEVTSATTNVLIESANFNPISIRRTSRSMRMRTDAAYRFERGLPRQLPLPALKRAVELMLEVAGGVAATGIVDAYPLPGELPEIFLSPAEVKRVLGIDQSIPRIAELLERLGCQVTREDGGLKVVSPMLRTDLNIPADLCEEIARMLGYEEIPSTLPIGRPPEPTINEDWRWYETLRHTLVGLGLSEIVTYALTSRERLGRLMGNEGRLAGASAFMAPADIASGYGSFDLAQEVTARFAPLDVEPVELVNPLSADSECLRTTTFASALETLRNNLRVAERDVALFELGRTYIPRVNDLPEERRMLTVVAGAYRSGPRWGEQLPNDFFWLKGIAEATLGQLGIRDRIYRPLWHPIFHGARSAAIVIPGATDRLIGVLGEVEPDIRTAFDVAQPAFLFALDLDVALSLATRARTVTPIPRFPPVVQDLAVIVGSEVTSAEIEDLIRQAGMPLVKSIELFDVYQGAPIPAGKISLGYHITYQAPDRTLTDPEVAEVHDKIVHALVGTLGAEIRR
jgi:phenylalanyl-tRNA synthetase beta chain